MDWLATLDVALFRFGHEALRNPVFDWLMPILSGNALFAPVLALALVGLLWKGGPRGRVFVLLLVLTLWLGDTYICKTLKELIGRPRPFLALEGVHVLVGKGSHASMPSSHAANWAAAALLVLIYYGRRAFGVALAVALGVGFSRIYNGVHYPSDVLVGFVLGAGYAACGAWTLNALWHKLGRRGFPLWWERLPSLLQPELRHPPQPPSATQPAPQAGLSAHETALNRHWLRLGYVLIGGMLLARLAYLAHGVIELSEDEAYQWVWSKHLALSYYSKPPLIAYTQFLGTSLWGDTELGVRFFSPVFAALLSVLVLRFFAREFSARAGVMLVLIATATPLLAAGAILMTVDPLLVLFWTAAMLAGWRAVRPEARTQDWLWVGLWMGLGFLSKYTALLQWLCWAVFFALWPPARAQLRRPGPYLALLVNGLCTLPVLIWNWQHGWVTLGHLADNANLEQSWRPTVKYFLEFVGTEAALLNPVFFGGALWAAVAFWRTGRQDARQVYLFSMGAPLFAVYLLYTLHSRVLGNWIAASVVPLFCLMVAYWDGRWRSGARWVKGWLVGGLTLGLVVVGLLHDTRWVSRIIGFPLPPDKDPHRRVRAWKETAQAVAEARARLQAEGKPVFIIASNYGMTGQLSFYLPEARTNIRTRPLVFFRTTARPVNQFYFWPGYRERTGQNAIYVQSLKLYRPPAAAPPPELLAEFGSVTDWGVVDIKQKGRVFRRLHLFACRDLR